MTRSLITYILKWILMTPVTSRMKTLWFKKAYFINSLVWFELLKVFQSEIFFLAEAFVSNLCNFDIAENVNIVGTAF